MAFALYIHIVKRSWLVKMKNIKLMPFFLIR